MPNTIIKDSGIWRVSKRIFRKDAGVQLNIRRIYRKYLGVWKLVFGSIPGSISYTTAGTYTFIPDPGVTTATVKCVVDLEEVGRIMSLV